MDNVYDIILADPPWTWYGWSEKGVEQRSPQSHYSVMNSNQICSLPINDLAKKNSVLFMWAVWSNLPEALKTITAWGFEYKTIAWVWLKMTNDMSRPTIGLGHYTRVNSEPCLLASKGKSIPVAVRNELASILSPRRKHSQKPDEQYEKIERLYPNKRYLELFARQKRFGWDSWGNEIDSDIEILFKG